ncbi:hypothetical protein GCM10023403_29610 [Pseudonocardia benzenivorans]
MANDGAGASGPHRDDPAAGPQVPGDPTPPEGTPSAPAGPADGTHAPAHAMGVPRPDPDPVTPPSGAAVVGPPAGVAESGVPAAGVPDRGSASGSAGAGSSPDGATTVEPDPVPPGVGEPGAGVDLFAESDAAGVTGAAAAVDPHASGASSAADAGVSRSERTGPTSPVAAPAQPPDAAPGRAEAPQRPWNAQPPASQPGPWPTGPARPGSWPTGTAQSGAWPSSSSQPVAAQQGGRPDDTVHLSSGPRHAGPQPPWTAGDQSTRTAPEPGRRRGGLIAGLVAALLVAALLGGGVGGWVGYRLADRGQPPAASGSVLDQPLPDVDANPAAAGPVEAVADRVLPSTVQLRVTGVRTEGEGSGMILSADGLILTNNHVVADAANGGTVTAVFQDGRSAPATIVGRDPSSDVAVVRASNVHGLTPIELGNSDGVRVGQPVVAFGSPLGLGGTVTTGIISALDRAVGVGGDALSGSDPTVFSALQTDAAINPGNSGGPLVDMQGRVIGINSAIATTGSQGGSIGVGFAIPVNSAKRIAQELETTGRATRAVLGVGVADDQTITGARIQSVVPGGPADAAGIRPGDVVVKFGQKQIVTGLDLQAQIRSAAPGAVLPVQLSDRTVQVTLGSATG